MRNKFILTFLIILLTSNVSNAIVDIYNSPELIRSYGKEQIRTKVNGRTVIVTPNYQDRAERNERVSEKLVCIADKHVPYGGYGALVTLYTPIGNYVGHHYRMQQSANGYGYVKIWCGEEGDKTPKFDTIQKAKSYYYPNIYKTDLMLRK